MTEVFTEATLCFPIRGDEVLLAQKQKKLGAGFLNGFGGKLEPGDNDIYATNTREVEEEVGMRIVAAKKVGEIVFHNPSDDDELKKMIVHIFTATKWRGEPKETDEMKNVAWYKIIDLDYTQSLSADKLFVPSILEGRSVQGIIEYNDDWSVRSSMISEVDGF
jgi:8-oxo-dGTP diphosphatase